MDDTATPDSAAEDSHTSAAPKGPAVKDKQCQYCQQSFTSSSLGRHLDQYLHKKKPDGIHDVDEIRRLRGGITRRQARHSSKQESDEPSIAKSSPAPTVPSPRVPTTTASNLNPTPPEGYQISLNTPNWQSTGVINGIPGSPAFAVPQQGPGSLKRNLTRIETPAKPADPGETARALELALREVLDNVRAAHIWTQPRPSPFDFELQAQTYPSLCLLTLPPPPTLFAVAPFSTLGAIPLEAPGPQHYDFIRQKLRMQIEQWKSDQLSARLSNLSSSSTGPSPSLDDPDLIARTARQHEEMAFKHLDLSFQNWQNLGPPQQAERWQLEILRAFAREADKKREGDAQLLRVQQEANALRQQVETLSRCQWPREFALFPPEPMSMGRETAKELGRTAAGRAEHWDYDRLVGKWRRHVREDATRRAGLVVARAPTSSIPPSPVQTPSSGHSTGRGMALPPANKKPRLSNGQGGTLGTRLGEGGGGGGEQGRDIHSTGGEPFGSGHEGMDQAGGFQI